MTDQTIRMSTAVKTAGVTPSRSRTMVKLKTSSLVLMSGKIAHTAGAMLWQSVIVMSTAGHTTPSMRTVVNTIMVHSTQEVVRNGCLSFHSLQVRKRYSILLSTSMLMSSAEEETGR